MPSLKASVSSGRAPSLDDVCTLVALQTQKDDLGQPVKTGEIGRQIFCARTSVSRAEFAAAGQQGLRPDVELLVDSDEYDAETIVDYSGTRFTVYRNYLRPDGLTELYCEVKVGAK